jgi:hypothetical protein
MIRFLLLLFLFYKNSCPKNFPCLFPFHKPSAEVQAGQARASLEVQIAFPAADHNGIPVTLSAEAHCRRQAVFCYQFASRVWACDVNPARNGRVFPISGNLNGNQKKKRTFCDTKRHKEKENSLKS